MTNGKMKQQGKETEPMSRGAKMAVFKRIAKYLFAHKGLIAICFSMMLVSNLLSLAAPKLSQMAIDEIVPPTEELGDIISSDQDFEVNVERVIFFCSIMLGFYVVSAILSYLLAILMVKLSQKVVYSMRKELFEHLTSLPVGYFDTHATGEIISRISYDIDTVNTSLSHDLLQIGASCVTLIGSLIMMASISPFLLCVFLITLPMSIIYANYRSKKIRPLFRKRSQKLGELNGYAEEMLSGQKTIRAYGREKVITGRFDEKNNDAVTAYYNAEYHAATVGPTVNFINNFSLSLVGMTGGILYLLSVLNAMGSINILPMFLISFGGVSAFVQYSRRFAGPIGEFANIISDLQSAASSAEKVFTIMDTLPEKPDNTDAIELTGVDGRVDMEGVKFGYVPERTIIKNLSLKVNKGDTIAIVGPTGAGKTTIINLLMRFYDVDEGEIRLDGNPIEDVTRKSLRKAYTMVLQDTWLFHGTIYENITYGREGATREDVERVAKMARIHSYIECLPEGYDTVLSDDGVNISKGHKQLITIARAMLADSPILILDEATSNVDSRTEQQIQAAMHELMKDRTCFVIAHRLSTIQNADVILVVKDGNVIEQGTHDELMESKGFYHSLYHSQFEN